jgi:hypothetical protein
MSGQVNYPEELLRISQNKAVCYRALLQNIFVQMDKSKDYPKELGFAREIIGKLIQNQNFSMKFLSEQIGLDEATGVISEKKR